ncbi:tRNA (adenosine(37)-N6)-threonylcarbamoyltransferase complex ATPase subunit type 1 TsaE [candidate division KSB1 bacterium]|nr:tRNA (adenosine(37)-N6)-threonylcarbamoyltransferase complex ATPase subunit type 1 TsaE [bacterium]RKY79622.1 MAG: tRNA (adenosine(37)-N6)-threonylcarbamoyltransferase complex ATPase subunit type 1 TsaE [candidate division KSB1 bacterium]
MVLISKSPEDTIKIGRKFAHILFPNAIVALVGSLGSGKTVFVKGICQGLGITQEVTSPSFALMNVYQNHIVVFHFDFFRLNSLKEIADLGIEEFLFANGISVIEWAEKAKSFLGDDCIWVTIERLPEMEETSKENWRRIKIEGLPEHLKTRFEN